MIIPKIIACDMDGTLLLGGAQRISAEAFHLIKQLKKHHILFIAASGRQYANLRLLFEPVADDIGYLSEDGCLCVINNEIIDKQEMERNLAEDIINDILNRAGCEVQISAPDVQYLMPKTDFFYHHMKEVVRANVKIISDLGEITGPVLRLSLYNPALNKDDEIYWKEKYGNRCVVQASGPGWLDFMPTGVNKGSGLQKILDYLHIPAQDCIAFGDNENDKEMLELVGCPITMKTGNPTILSLGRYTTDKVENTLQQILNTLKGVT